MKNNVFERKIKKLELLQNSIESMQRTMDDLIELMQKNIINFIEQKTIYEQKFTYYAENEAEIWYIENTQKSIEEYTLKLNEIKNSFTELEKMA